MTEKREMRLVAEWAERNFPDAELRFRVRLGGLDPELQDAELTPEEVRMLGNFRRWADAVLIEPGAVHLVEAKIRNVPGALEQLDLYARLLPLTPELAHLRGRPVIRHLVAAVDDPVVSTLARERGIRVHHFRPQWVDEYLATLSGRARRPPQPRGLEPELLDDVEEEA